MSNAASHAKHSTLILHKLHITLCSHTHNTDLINIIIISARVERDNTAPHQRQSKGTRVKQQGERDLGHARMSFLSFHLELHITSPTRGSGFLYCVWLHCTTYCHSIITIPKFCCVRKGNQTLMLKGSTKDYEM